MKKITNYKYFAFALTALACVCFTTCENPIIEKWWIDPEQEYIGVYKEVPLIELATETVIKEINLPPGEVLQNIEIINIEYVLFAGESRSHNGGPEQGAAADLSTAERKSNNSNIVAMAEELRDHDNYQIILHGHANPVFGTEQEISELQELSTIRAVAVKDVLVDLYSDGTPPVLIPPMG